MAEEVENTIPDGTISFLGGQNAALSPANIGENQYFAGVNISAQKGTVTPRWGMRKLKLDFTNTGNYTRESGREVSYEQVFHSGKFQAFIPYSVGPDFFIIYVVSGFLFLVSLNDYSVRVLNPSDKVDPTAQRINWSNGGNYLVIFDFPNLPLILRGLEVWRSNPAEYEVPVSRLGAYNQNRLFISNAGNEFTAGDPAGSTAAPKAPITFLEVLLPSTGFTGQVFQLSTNYGNDTITAMGFLQVIDKNTEIGPLIVASRRAIYSYATDTPRLQWAPDGDPSSFGSVLLYSNGITGQRAQTNMNSDYLFLCDDGQIRALSMAREDQKKWGNAPISAEVENFLIYNDKSLDKYAFMSYHQNKIFCSCNPFRVDCQSAEGVPQTDIAHGGVVVIELNNVAGLTIQQAGPVWAGLWTGTRFMDMCENNKICYIAGKDGNSNELYIFDPSITYDVIDGKERDVRSVLFTREYQNQDGTVNKKLHSVELGLKKLAGNVSVEVSYKPSHFDEYIYWREFFFHAPVRQCVGMPRFPNGLAPHSIRDLNTGGVDENACSPSTDEILSVYKGVQIRAVITGRGWELDYVKLKSIPMSQPESDVYCEELKNIEVPRDCFNLWYIPDGQKC